MNFLKIFPCHGAAGVTIMHHFLAVMTADPYIKDGALGAKDK